MITKEQRDAIRIRLAEIEQAGGGRLTPAAVVEDARDPDSPLHSQFEWDVEKASQAYWLDQARALITSVRVLVRTDKSSVRTVFYIRDPSAGVSEQGYVSINRLRSDADLARESLVAEFGRVADMLRRARELAVALDASDDVEQLLTAVVGMRSKLLAAQPSQSQ